VKIERFADLTEVWLDQFDQKISPEDLGNITSKPLLLVNKSKKEQGKGSSSEQQRLQILSDFLVIKPKYVDTGVSTSTKSIQQLKLLLPKGTRLILSYHNYKKTPALQNLKSIVIKAIKSGADIVKVATFAQRSEDNLILFELLAWAKKKKYPMIGHCMGSKGRISRIMAPIFGSKIVFVSGDAKTASAPGQITHQQYQDIQSLISDSL
jgi:3-dehydroquinate dehydratase-1